MPSISFKNNGIEIALKNKLELRNFLATIFRNEGFKFHTISFVFSTDEFLLELNKKFLKHNFFTDILTFQLSEDNQLISADIYISIERVKENAKNFGISYLHELYRVMIHGILHLCGFSDNTPKLKAAMRERENFYLNKLVSRETFTP